MFRLIRTLYAGHSRRTRLATLLLIASIEPNVIAVPSISRPFTLEQRLDSIRAAFLADDSRLLRGQFRNSRPVYVSVPYFERGRFLGPGPLQALLERIVAETEPIGFEFSPPGDRARPSFGLSRFQGGLESPGDEPAQRQHEYIKARWTYIETGSHERRVVDLYLAIQRQPEDGEWRIVEIKGLA